MTTYVSPPLPHKPPRKSLKPGEVLCQYCTAKCCRYFALPIDTPTRRKDFEFLRWYLMHGEASIFVEGKTWYLMVHAVCRNLQDDHRCAIYETRPQICRDYSTKNCEYEDDTVYDMYFETPEQVDEYAEAVLAFRRQGEVVRSPQPPLLPVIG